MKKITPFLLGIGIILTVFGGLLMSTPKNVGAATVVSLGKNGTSQYLLYPTDTLSAYTFIATSTTASSSFANGINLTSGCFAIGSVCLPTVTTLGDYLTLSSWYSTTTDGLDEGSTNLYFTNPRVQTYLDTVSKGYFYSTTSADYWYTLQSKASSTLLGDTNTWSGTNQFNNLTFTNATGTSATTTNFFSTYVVGTNGTITSLIATNSTTTNATSTTIYNSGTASTTSLYVNGNPVTDRYHDGVYASSPTTTDELYKLGNCLEPSGRSVKIDKVAAIIASTTVGTPNQGITFNINIASSFSATPSSMFTSDQNVNSTSTQKSITTGFSNNVIPAGYCWWYDINSASTTQIGGWNLNLFGYEQ